MANANDYRRVRSALRGTTDDAFDGTQFYVNSVTGSDAAGYGYTIDAPTATIDYAIGLCTAAKGDVIHVMPSHAENVTTATGINCDVAGITIVGHGRAGVMPTVSFTAAAGSITVGAANVTIRNLKLVANFATGVTAGVTIAAAGDGCTLDGLVMRDAAANTEFLVHISVATTVTDLTIENCSLVGLIAESMTNSILFAGTSTDCTIRNNYIFVDSSDDTIDHLAGAAVNIHVHDNVIINQDTTSALYCFRNKSDGTGCVHDNRCGYNKVDAEMLIGAATWFFENYCSNTIAESGLLDPSTAHAIP